MASEKEKKLDKIKQQVGEFRAMFADNPVRHVKEGTWFTTLVRLVLDSHTKKVNAAYFRQKYPGLDQQRVAKRLVQSASNHMGLAGGVAGAAVSAAQISTWVTGGAAAAALAATLIGEISYITYHQLTLVYDLSIVLDAELDREDPEDLMTLFWFAFGVNLWEEAANGILLKTGPRAAEYLGRKALRAGTRKALQGVAARFGGTQLARKITERALLRLIVPGVNIPVAAGINYAFTKKLGKLAISNLNHRGVLVHPIRKLQERDRHFQLLALPTIFHVGIADESKEVGSRTVEMQAIVSRQLDVADAEEEILEDFLEMDLDGFLEAMAEIDDDEAADALVDVAVCAHLTSQADTSLASLKRYAEAVRQDGLERRIKRLSRKLEV